jgi:hypothetical protein
MAVAVLAVLVVAVLLLGSWRPDDPDLEDPEPAPLPPAHEPEIRAALHRAKTQRVRSKALLPG